MCSSKSSSSSSGEVSQGDPMVDTSKIGRLINEKKKFFFLLNSGTTDLRDYCEII
jgi:hypothetical protein